MRAGVDVAHASRDRSAGKTGTPETVALAPPYEEETYVGVCEKWRPRTYPSSEETMSSDPQNEQLEHPIHDELAADHLTDSELQSVLGGGPMQTGFERPT